MALQDGANIPVFVDGTALTTVTQINKETDTGVQPIFTINNGLAGFSGGAGSITITVNVWIPIGGLEYDFETKAAERALVDFQIGVGAKAYSGRGKIINCNVSQSAQAASEGSFTWQGELKKPD